MKNIKKVLTFILVAVLAAGITLAVTLAFLTDETTVQHNVFTAGNVSIQLTETVDGDTYGGVTSDADGGEYLLIAPGDKLTKEVKVKNTGSIPAYVAVTVKLNNGQKISQAIDTYYTALNYSEEQIQAIYDEIFEGWGLNYTEADAQMRLTITGADMPEKVLQVDSVRTWDDHWEAYAQNWFPVTAEADKEAPFDGYYTSDMDTYEIKYTYYLYLEPAEEAVLFTGINVPENFTTEQMAMFNGLEIDIQGAAIQAENFTDAKTAFTALKGVQDSSNA